MAVVVQIVVYAEDVKEVEEAEEEERDSGDMQTEEPGGGEGRASSWERGAWCRRTMTGTGSMVRA
ncbi:hypothetical protein E4U47_004996 [Claviceps purpurea]|nr:hypothetical protein E4U47_004996 [Claviceps purpurea]